MTPREMVRLLIQNGFEEVSQNGSHKKLYNSNTNKTIIVPYHSKELKKDWNRQLFRGRGKCF